MEDFCSYSYVLTAIAAAELIVQTFGPTILENIATPPKRGGVDISREERYDKCHSIAQQLSQLHAALAAQGAGSGKLSNAIHKLNVALSGF